MGSPILKFVFWQNIISPHQAGLLTALQQGIGVEVTLVVQEEMPAWRSNAGWTVPDLGDVRVVVDPSPSAIRELTYPGKVHVHVFSGLGAYAVPRSALREILSQDALLETRGIVLVAAEQLDDRGIKGALRRVKYRRLVRSHAGVVDAYLGYGLRACSDFQQFGVPADKTFPFAYFIPEDDSAREPDTTSQGPVRFMFIGRMEALKRVDLLLSALSRLTDHEWHLDLVGEGAMRRAWEERARQLGIGDRVTWLGALDNAEARAQLRKCDVFVLPSAYDGWGAVVNEALLAGARVVASTAAGASMLLMHDDLGTRFESGSEPALRRALTEQIRRGAQRRDERALVIDWASQCISPRRGAEYLFSIAGHLIDNGKLRPSAPWESR